MSDPSSATATATSASAGSATGVVVAGPEVERQEVVLTPEALDVLTLPAYDAAAE